ncbi:CocE/NonD family hydrolase [Jiangella gansuensis]|uniref:CocE/NonD family hydrolase n=1 Tax=Jiangella gansuensis TaxID=281473 RepID=UPI00047D1892|nr:CocE/NonD family hydrolase [Jiangella gansuensis]
MRYGTLGGAPFGASTLDRPPRDVFDAYRQVDLKAPRSFEAGIPMRDGVELAATVHLPAAEVLPAPAIVRGTPYDKGAGMPQDVSRKVGAGYVHVRYDVRGRGKSEGLWHPFTITEAQDGHDVVEWVAAQDWCDGAVGAEGLSYDGWTTMATISQNPPHLRAATPFSAAGRWQQEIPYTFGCFQLFFVWWWAGVRRRIMDSSIDVPALFDLLPVQAMGDALDTAGPGWAEWMEHDALDDLWRGRRFDGAYTFDVPTLHVTGWHDREDIQAAFHHYEQMMAHSPARDRQWLLVGPWSHVSSYYPTSTYKGIEYPGGTVDMAGIQLRFFDRFLRGEDNGVDDEPRVQIYDPGAKSWQIRPAWTGGTRKLSLYLGDDASLGAAPGAAGSQSYDYDPMAPNGLSVDLENLPLEPDLDLAELEAQPGVVSWTSAPFDDPVTIRGWGEAELWASTDGEDTEWHVKLADVDERGRALCVAWGCLRASHRIDLAAPEAVTPGAVERYSIELTPMFHTIRPGHRIRMVLASSEFPWFARNLNTFEPIATQAEPRVAHNSVFHGGDRPSRIRLEIES